MVSCFEPIKSIETARNGPLGNIAQLLHFAAQEKKERRHELYFIPQTHGFGSNRPLAAHRNATQFAGQNKIISIS
jgi:hypothetical protein